MSDGNAVLLLLRMVVSLAAVLGLLVLAVRLLQRRQGGGFVRRRRAAAPMVEVLARQSLSRNASLQVVRIGDDVLALGVSDSGVRVLSQVDPQHADDLRSSPLGQAAESGEADRPVLADHGLDEAQPVLTRRARRAAQKPFGAMGAGGTGGLESALSRQSGATGQIVRALLSNAGIRRG